MYTEIRASANKKFKTWGNILKPEIQDEFETLTRQQIPDPQMVPS